MENNNNDLNDIIFYLENHKSTNVELANLAYEKC
ncbi:hypothetical protein OTSTA716_2308 [Orientia tsutsugamushi str. TA716]|uniref:Uncharacterized protein n=1 Tax=Orientia tsutsugamushi str. TA716 TaxID=1359175 RepID=A0A0F3NTD9_ORITS|nr:hypothetical protein OTSTA716_2308 [Orientia tsutsugamushi str. TA716]